MRPVNLLSGPGAAERRRLPGVAMLAAGAAPLAVAGLVYLGWSSAHTTAVERAGELAAVQAQVDALRPSAAGAAEAAQLATATAQRTSAVRDVLGKQRKWDATLVGIARVLPADVWLTQLTLQSPTPAASAGAPAAAAAATPPQGLQAGGYARSQDAVAHTLARLALVPGLSDVTLASTTAATVGKRTVVQFQIGATIGAKAGS